MSQSIATEVAPTMPRVFVGAVSTAMLFAGLSQSIATEVAPTTPVVGLTHSRCLDFPASARSIAAEAALGGKASRLKPEVSPLIFAPRWEVERSLEGFRAGQFGGFGVRRTLEG